MEQRRTWPSSKPSDGGSDKAVKEAPVAHRDSGWIVRLHPSLWSASNSNGQRVINGGGGLWGAKSKRQGQIYWLIWPKAPTQAPHTHPLHHPRTACAFGTRHGWLRFDERRTIRAKMWSGWSENRTILSRKTAFKVDFIVSGQTCSVIYWRAMTVYWEGGRPP